MRQPPAPEQRRGRHQQIVVPGKRKPSLDQNLPAIRGDDLAGGPAQLKTTQRIPRRAAIRGRGRLGQHVERASRAGFPGIGQAGERWQAGKLGRGELLDLGDAPVLPAGHDLIGPRSLQNDRSVLGALQVGQGVQGQAQGLRDALGASEDRLDGQMGLMMSDAEPDGRVGDKDQRGHGALVGDTQSMPAEDGPEPPGLSA